VSPAASKRWQRRDHPWRATLKGVVVAGPNGVVEFEGAAAEVWRLLEAPTSHAELAAAFATRGAVDALEEFDPLARLVEHDLIREVP
jgi:hypothetical protein